MDGCGCAGQERILLVDDDVHLLTTLGDYLTHKGYLVETAQSAEEAIQQLHGSNPDLIILDMSMPGMGGIGFLRHQAVAADSGGFPVLVLTARTAMQAFFDEVDVAGFLTKPCPGERLLDSIRGILKISRSAAPQEVADQPT
jgi:DNA-binding response OmpR family regulator